MVNAQRMTAGARPVLRRAMRHIQSMKGILAAAHSGASQGPHRRTLKATARAVAPCARKGRITYHGTAMVAQAMRHKKAKAA
jgi:hypothetical protein